MARLILLSAVLKSVAAARSRSSFDFGWRYILGDQGFVPPSALTVARLDAPSDASGFCSFNINISGTQCYGL